MADIEYRYIPSFDGYRVGSDGSVWSNKKGRYNSDGNWIKLKPNVDKRNGSHKYHLYNDGKYYYKAASQWVMLAFVGTPQPGHVVRHLNDNPADNRLENLAYGTVADNAEDARRNGKLCIGESHGMSKLTEVTVRLIRKLRSEGMRLMDICEQVGHKKSVVSHVITRRLWGHVE